MAGESNIGPQETDAQKYDRVLGSIIQEHLLSIIEAEGKDINTIISVACGMGLELDALMRLFPQARYLGVDADARLVSYANRFNKYKERAQFIAADLKDRNALAGHSADLLIIRNPQIAIDSAFVDTKTGDWEAIFRNSLAALGPGGIVYVSTIYQEETDAARNYLRQGNVHIITSRTTSPQEPLPSTDSHVMIGKKTS